MGRAGIVLGDGSEAELRAEGDWGDRTSNPKSHPVVRKAMEGAFVSVLFPSLHVTIKDDRLNLLGGVYSFLPVADCVPTVARCWEAHTCLGGLQAQLSTSEGVQARLLCV